MKFHERTNIECACIPPLVVGCNDTWCGKCGGRLDRLKDLPEYKSFDEYILLRIGKK